MSSALAGTAAACEAQEDFLQVPAGAVVRLPSGDSLVVERAGWLVSDSALVAMDRSLRDCRADREARAEQVALLTEALDSVTLSLRAEQAWRSATTAFLDRDTGWREFLENTSLVGLGFLSCRAGR